MSDRHDDVPGDAGPPDPLEAVLAGALEARAGGPVVVADGSPMGARDEDRLAAIDAEVAGSSGARRRFQVVGVAAAVVVTLLVGSLVLTRSDDSTQVDSIGDTPTTTAPEPRPGTTVADPVPTSVDSTVPQPISTGDLAGFDPANFTYPSSVCSGLLDNDAMNMPSAPFTLVDGSVYLPMEMTDGRSFQEALHVRLDGMVLGDVTADGHEDAILTLLCGVNQSDGIWPSIVVVSDVAGTPTVLGAVSHSGFETTLTETNTETGETSERPRHEDLVWVRSADGRLLLRWNQNGGMGRFDVDQREMTVTYGWDGTTFVPLGESDVVVIPAQPYVPPPFNQVEAFDFRSIVLVIDTRLRVGDHERVACGGVFRDVPVSNVQLVDGESTVWDGGGNEVGTVAIETVSTTNLDDDDLLEAVVRIRCTRGSASVSTVAVFEATSGPPDLVWSPTNWGVYDDVIDVEIGGNGSCPLTVTYRSTGTVTPETYRVPYRRDFLTYVADFEGCTGG